MLFLINGRLKFSYLYGSVKESAVIVVIHLMHLSAPSPFIPLDLVVFCIDVFHNVAVLLTLLFFSKLKNISGFACSGLVSFWKRV